MIIDDFKIRNFFNHYEDVKECLKKKLEHKIIIREEYCSHSTLLANLF